MSRRKDPITLALGKIHLALAPLTTDQRTAVLAAIVAMSAPPAAPRPPRKPKAPAEQ